MISLAELLTPRTATQVRDRLLARLGALGFPVTSWASGGVARTLVEGVAFVVADVEELVALIAAGGLLDTAKGRWLTLLARSAFDVERQLATFAVGAVTFTASPGAGPYTLAPGAMIVGRQASGTNDALRYTAITGGTLNPGGTLTVLVKAEGAGTAYNVGAGELTYLFTPLPGVTATNASTWLSADGASAGRDEQSDAALRQQCRDRWATLAVAGATEAWYRYVARAAKTAQGEPAGAARVLIVRGPGDGSLRVVVAGPSGPMSSGEVSAIQAWIDARHPPTDAPTVVNATLQVIPVTGLVRFVAGANTSANQIAVKASVRAYVNALDLGDEYASTVVDEAGIKAAIYAGAPGLVSDVDLTAPNADVTVQLERVAVDDMTSLAFA